MIEEHHRLAGSEAAVLKRKSAADSRWGEEVGLSGKSFRIGG
jgi:hypothetical protein